VYLEGLSNAPPCVRWWIVRLIKIRSYRFHAGISKYRRLRWDSLYYSSSIVARHERSTYAAMLQVKNSAFYREGIYPTNFSK
jgi:hypothetical protein